MENREAGGIAGGGAASGGVHPEPPTGLPPRPRRQRRKLEGHELATPLTASFLGLLIVHGLHPVAAAEVQGAAGAGAASEPLPADAESMVVPAAMTSPQPAAIVPTAVPTAPLAGDPLAGDGLTRIDDGAPFAFAHGDAPHAATDGSPALAMASLATPTTVSFDLGQGGFELPAWPSLGETSTAPVEEPVGPIGRYVQGDGTDRTVVLTDADDIFVGGDGDEHVLGLGGDDRLDGAGGDDWLEGGAGRDILSGGSGADLLDGGTGDDRLDGGEGDDRLLGGGGADLLDGGSGSDVVDGGTGTDVLAGGTGDDVLILRDVRDASTELALGADAGGNDTVVVADGYGASLAQALPETAGKATFVLGRPDLASFPHDVAGFRQQIDPDIENIRLEGTGGHDVVGDDRDSIIVGNAGANHLYGGGGVDRIAGGGGSDWLHGGAGDDWIDGGDGNDWIDGGAGADTRYGGAGDDTFVLGLHEAAGDQIFDHQGRNTLSLQGADPGLLVAQMRGDDLVLTYADQDVATVHGYAQHADAYRGIDLGHGVQAIDDFMASATTAMRAESADWLADYLPSPATTGDDALPEPWADAGADILGGTVPIAAAPGQPLPPDPPGDGDMPASTPAVLPATADPIVGADLWLPVDPEHGAGAAADLDPVPADGSEIHADKQHPATG